MKRRSQTPIVHHQFSEYPPDDELPFRPAGLGRLATCLTVLIVGGALLCGAVTFNTVHALTQPQPTDDPRLPTLLVLPSETATETATATITFTPGSTPTPLSDAELTGTAVASITPSITASATMTETPYPGKPVVRQEVHAESTAEAGGNEARGMPVEVTRIVVVREPGQPAEPAAQSARV